MSTFKIILNILLSAMTALWYAVTTVVWGIAGFFLLAMLILNFKQDTAVIAPLLLIVSYVMQYWWIFFVAILVYRFITDYREISKKEEKHETAARN